MTDNETPNAFERERAEPYETPRGMPALMAMLLGALGAWGATYFWYEAGDMHDLLLGDGRTAFRVEANVPVPDPAAAAPAPPDGARIYRSVCAACHQMNGQGVVGAFPPLAQSTWVTGDARGPAAIVLQGLQGPIEVRDVYYNGVMPAFGGRLDDAEVAAVVNHIRSSWGNDAPPVTEEEVTALRQRLRGSGMIVGGDGVRTLTGGP